VKEDFMCDVKLRSDGEKSVARIQLMKTDNPSAFATVNCNVCRITVLLYLPVLPSCLREKGVNKSNHLIRTRIICHATTPTCDSSLT
jgi:hypothetical protein